MAITLTPDDTVIALMGVTGVGKSSFIQLFTDDAVGIGENLESFTTQVAIFACKLPSSDQKFYLVDTPGFDDSNRPDQEILRELSSWLTKTYSEDIRLSGIIYLHRIADVRFGGSAMRNLSMFKKLCGDENLPSVVLATTFWRNVDEEIGEKREQQLKNTPDFWGSMVNRGSRTFRHDSAEVSGAAIIQYIIDRNTKAHKPVYEIQDEMVNKKKTLEQTAAGAEVLAEMEKVRRRYEQEIEDLKKEMQSAMSRQDAVVREEMARERRKAEEFIERELRERQKMHTNVETLWQQREIEREMERSERIKRMEILQNQYLQLEQNPRAVKQDAEHQKTVVKLKMQIKIEQAQLTAQGHRFAVKARPSSIEIVRSLGQRQPPNLFSSRRDQENHGRHSTFAVYQEDWNLDSPSGAALSETTGVLAPRSDADAQQRRQDTTTWLHNWLRRLWHAYIRSVSSALILSDKTRRLGYLLESLTEPEPLPGQSYTDCMCGCGTTRRVLVHTAEEMAKKTRKSHTMPRKGCRTCKRRHIRCDENFPECRNCIKRNCRCDYMDTVAAGEEPLKGSKPSDHLISSAKGSTAAIPLATGQTSAISGFQGSSTTSMRPSSFSTQLQSQPLPYAPSYPPNAQTGTSTTPQSTPSDISSWPRFLLLCLNKGKYDPVLRHIPCPYFSSDIHLFHEVRRHYGAMKRFGLGPLSLQLPVDVHLTKLQLLPPRQDSSVGILEVPSIPPEEEVVKHKRYHYVPCPAKAESFLLLDDFLHGFFDPREHTSNLWVERLPKKLLQPLAYRNTQDPAIGWGIHIIEGPNMLAVTLLLLAMLLLTCLFCILWTTVRHGAISDAYGMGSFIMALLSVGLAAFYFYWQQPQRLLT